MELMAIIAPEPFVVTLRTPTVVGSPVVTLTLNVELGA